MSSQNFQLARPIHQQEQRQFEIEQTHFLQHQYHQQQQQHQQHQQQQQQQQQQQKHQKQQQQQQHHYQLQQLQYQHPPLRRQDFTRNHVSFSARPPSLRGPFPNPSSAAGPPQKPLPRTGFFRSPLERRHSYENRSPESPLEGLLRCMWLYPVFTSFRKPTPPSPSLSLYLSIYLSLFHKDEIRTITLGHLCAWLSLSADSYKLNFPTVLSFSFDNNSLGLPLSHRVYSPLLFTQVFHCPHNSSKVPFYRIPSPTSTLPLCALPFSYVLT